MLFNIELPKKLNKFNYFKKEEKGCKLYSYNGINGNDIYIISEYPDLEISKDFCIVNTTLEAIMKLQPNVEITLNEKSIVAKSGKGKFSGKYVESNLIVPFMDFANTCNVNLEKLVKATNFVSTNEKKPILTGVNLNQNGVIIATDSFKLYKYEDVERTELLNPTNITIASSFIKLADSLFDNKNLIAKYSNTSISIQEDNLMLVGNLLDGNYPNVKKIFESLNGDKISLDRKDLLEAIEITKAAGIEYIGKEKVVYATLSEGKFTGVGTDTFEKEIKYNGKTITVNAIYLEIALKSFETDEIDILVKDATLSCLTAKDRNDEQIILLGIKNNN